MSGSIILYVAYTKLTDEHHLVLCGNLALWVRAESCSALSVGGALDAARPMDGEIVMNTIHAEEAEEYLQRGASFTEASLGQPIPPLLSEWDLRNDVLRAAVDALNHPPAGMARERFVKGLAAQLAARDLKEEVMP